MKILILFLSLHFSFGLFSQVPSDYKIIQEKRIYYSDSINDNKYYGRYEPTDLIGLADDSFIISSKFSINFPGQYSYSTKRTEKEKALHNKMHSKSHSSSGSLIKINKDLKKQWELIFKDNSSYLNCMHKILLSAIIFALKPIKDFASLLLFIIHNGLL